MLARLLLVLLCTLALLLVACGGGPKAQTGDLVAIHQPTPDPTLDAVVRDLPHALAGVVPTSTPTPKPAPALVQKPAAPTPRPAPPAPKPTATAAHH